MSRADWRVSDSYEGLRSLDAPGFAWEYLRRNADFLRERQKLRRDSDQGILDQAEVRAFTRRWGLRFRESGPDDPPEPDSLGTLRTAERHRSDRLAA